MSYYFVLSMDGGGIRGVMTAVLLSRLQAACPFLDRVHLIAGTSAGGIIALALAAGFTPEEILALFETSSAAVFADTVLDDLLDLGKLVGADYSTEPLKRLLTDYFGDMTLADLPHKVLISSFDLDAAPVEPGHIRRWKAKFFHNFPGEDSDGDQRLVDVALRSSAAPTYFPTYQGFIDGGVVANNPSMCALAQALHQATGGQTIDRVVLLSVGTGENPRYLEVADGDWGLAQWARHLVNLILEGSVNLANYQCRQALGDRFYRLDPVLPVPIGLDQLDQIDVLKQIALDVDLGPVIAWLERYFGAD